MQYLFIHLNIIIFVFIWFSEFSPREIIYAAPNEALQMLQEDHPIYSWDGKKKQ